MKPKFYDSYIVFDTETTGLKDYLDEIIEIGAIKVVHNEIVEEFDVLIKPQVSIPKVITEITGITDKMVAKEKEIADVLPRFIEFIEDFPLVAHNAPFDLGFLNTNLIKNHLPQITNETIDTIELARKYIPKAYNYKLETLKKYFHLDFGSHRSVEDCKTTNYIYQECKKRAMESIF